MSLYKTDFEIECALAYEELSVSGAIIIGKRRKDGQWDARTYRMLNDIRERAQFNGMEVSFDKSDGSVQWKN